MPDLMVKVPAIEKLVDYAASGVGAIAGPMLANWRASKEGKARLTSARVDAEVRRIETESEAQSLMIIADAQAKARQSIDTTSELGRGMMEITRDDIAQSIEFQGRKRLANVRSVVEDTANELGDKEVPDHEPDPDWTARFFDCVQDVSSEDMRKVWARILAGEVESPGRTSLRTLDTLKNMTKRDAEMFREICGFILNNHFAFYGDSAKSIETLNYGNLLHLQDCGLLNVGPFLAQNFQWGERKEFVLNYQNTVLSITRDSEGNSELSIPSVILTTSGRELFQFVQCTPQMEYLQAFSKFLKTKSCRLEYLEGVVPLPRGLSYTNRIPIEPNPGQPDGSTP